MSDERRLADSLLAAIGETAARIGRPVRIMEVCGTHTVELRRQGIHSLLPPGITLVSGPGCPVCVTPAGYIDNAMALARGGKALVATFGDMLKVPGSDGTSLASLTGSGAVKLLYSPSELSALARRMKMPVVFLAVGFETTIPVVLSALLAARASGLANVLLYTGFKTIIPALRHLLANPGHGIDGFLLPGHVSVVIGPEAYGLLGEPGGRPGVITGFEALDMLLGILLVLRRVARGERGVENAYPRAVKPGGNAAARRLMEEHLVPRDDAWRGLGVIPGCGLALRPSLAEHDAEIRFALPEARDVEAPGCLCARVISGTALPADCGLFGLRCTPEDPVGPCMVSSEGACAAHLRYGGAA